jgi:hypothetical protein
LKKGGHNRNNRCGKRNSAQQGKNKGKKFSGACKYCGKPGHEEKDCRKKHPEKLPTKVTSNAAI